MEISYRIFQHNFAASFIKGFQGFNAQRTVMDEKHMFEQNSIPALLSLNTKAPNEYYKVSQHCPLVV